jgi:murein DD-endopeptidase MepM/ murein hydrolase activator NlpD
MDKPPNLKTISDTAKKLIGRVNLNNKKVGAAVVVALALSTGIYLYVSNIGYNVYINGTSVGIVKGKKMVEEVVAEITEEIGKNYADDNLIIGAELKLEKVKLSGETPVDRHSLKERIKNCIDLKKQAVTLYIEGQPVVSLMGKKNAEEVLKEIKKSFVSQDQEVTLDNIYFKEKVDIVERAVEIETLMNPEDALRYLVNGTTETKVYTVKKGDSFWLISKSYNISMEDLEKANPGVNPKRLQIGQQLNMIVPKPFITVVTEETCTYKEKIPFQTEYKESNEFFKGESIVKIYGKYGEREVTAKVVKENGMEVSREILDEKVIKEPVARLVALGTKPPPPRQGTGTFSYPARGRITSGFGWRWGRRHNGIDIALPVGTPVKAADGGTVKFSGRYGDYGNLVIIDHGDGYETYYGHNKNLLVSKGDKVYKGQTIALSGETGRATGPHLHFEVRRFGVPANPLKFLDDLKAP